MTNHSVTTRRRFIATTAAGASALAATSNAAFAQGKPDAPKTADFLFVQSAKGKLLTCCVAQVLADHLTRN
jgi:hypothetical protein